MAEVSETPEGVKQRFTASKTATMPSTMSSDEEAVEWKKEAALKYASEYDAAIAAKKAQKEKEEEFDLDAFPVREWSIQLPFLADPIAFNPVVSLIGVGFLWGIAIWCMGKQQCDATTTNTVT